MDEAGKRLQLTYGAATGKQFRPERIESSDVSFRALVLEVVEEVR
jgi:hypothetical protein